MERRRCNRSGGLEYWFLAEHSKVKPDLYLAVSRAFPPEVVRERKVLKSMLYLPFPFSSYLELKPSRNLAGERVRVNEKGR